MARVVVVVLAGALLLGPGVSLVGVAVLMNPAAHASCVLTAPGAGLSVGDVPDHLDVTTSDGVNIRLEQNQLVHAATVIDTGARTSGVGRDGLVVALMAALTESSLRMLSNTGAYPASANYPNDGDGGDHDSLGLFQMRPSTGWGSVAELMDSSYQPRAFYGGPTGPNHGSPRGLLDIPGWQQMPKGAAAQAVEVSAYPDRYARFEPVAKAILDSLTGSVPAASSSEVPESGRIVFPLPAGTWTRTSGFGMRVHPIAGERTLHTGVDLAATAGTPILAAADGKVTFAGPASGYGNLILIEHTIGGALVVSGYAQMYADDIHVHPGDRVTAGQHIADVGSAGNSTGPHLHFEIRPGSANGAPIDPEPWLAGHAAASVDRSAPTAAGGCGTATAMPAGDPAPYPGGDPRRLVDDPTTDGKITARTAYILAQVQAAFPGSAWSCWSQRSGPSEHPLGRACDGTFGNSIGTPATGEALEQGWAAVNWLKDNAQELGVEYLIWQGRIWSVARAAEGWRKYDGGGMHDPDSVTGGHFDHAHWTSEF
jgi:murein DD-endopeptidase MepM/ murein hydrolase activator NlpD